MLFTFVDLTVSGVLTASFLALGAIGLTMTFGILRFANVAHPDFMTLGAYGVLVFNVVLGLPLLPSVVLGLIASVAVGLALSWVAFERLRIRGAVPLLIVSIGLSFILRYGLQFAFGGGEFHADRFVFYDTAGVSVLIQIEIFEFGHKASWYGERGGGAGLQVFGPRTTRIMPDASDDRFLLR